MAFGISIFTVFFLFFSEISEPNSPHRLVGRLLIFSGKTGEVLRWANTPDERETYFSPVLYTKKDSAELVLFGTGGETHPGGLWVVSLMDLFHGLIENSKIIYKDDYKGMSKLAARESELLIPEYINFIPPHEMLFGLNVPPPHPSEIPI